MTNLSISSDGNYLAYVIINSGKIGLLKITNTSPTSIEEIIINSDFSGSDISTYNNLKILLNSDGSLLFRNINST